MLETLNLMGAISAYVIYISSILTFLSRLIGRDKLGQAFGYATLLMGFPLASVSSVELESGHSR